MQHNGTGNETAPIVDLETCGHAVECWFQENPILTRFIFSILVFVMAWVVRKISERALVRSAKRIARLRRLDEQQTKAAVGRTQPIRLIITISLGIVVVLSLLAIWGLQTAFTGMLAGAGFMGIVIGLAAADTIGDIIAGFLIFYNHPFDIGDWVVIDGVEGIVEDVALGATTVLSFDNEKVTIPNRVVEGSQIKNLSHARKLRRRLQVGVEYGSHLGLAMATLVRLAENHPDVMDEPEPSAVTMGFGASSVDLELRFYVEPVRSSVIQTYTDLIHEVHDEFRRLGIGIAFPHMQIMQGGAFHVAHDMEGGDP